MSPIYLNICSYLYLGFLISEFENIISKNKIACSMEEKMIKKCEIKNSSQDH